MRADVALVIIEIVDQVDEDHKLMLPEIPEIISDYKSNI